MVVVVVEELDHRFLLPLFSLLVEEAVLHLQHHFSPLPPINIHPLSHGGGPWRADDNFNDFLLQLLQAVALLHPLRPLGLM